MTLKINGTDITYYIARGGVKWTRADVESPNAGRTLDGVLHRGRVGTKIRLDITCRPLRSWETSILLNLILPEYVEVTYDDPMYGRVVKRMYSNNNPASYCMSAPDAEWWNGITFPLIEV